MSARLESRLRVPTYSGEIEHGRFQLNGYHFRVSSFPGDGLVKAYDVTEWQPGLKVIEIRLLEDDALSFESFLRLSPETAALLAGHAMRAYTASTQNRSS